MNCLMAIRERSMMECFDLGLVLMRRFGWKLALLSLPGMFIVLGVSASLVMSDVFDGGELFWLLSCLLYIMFPFVSAPITWYLGQIMFFRPCGWGDFWQSFKGSWLSTFWLGIVLRAVVLLFVITIFIYPSFVFEVCILERQGTKRSWKRIVGLSKISPNPAIAWCMLYMVVTLVFVFCAAWGIGELWHMVRYQIGYQDNPFSYVHVGESLLPVVLWWPVAIYISVVRFLGYLDVRTRMEGWAVSHRLSHFADEVGHGG